MSESIRVLSSFLHVITLKRFNCCFLLPTFTNTIFDIAEECMVWGVLFLSESMGENSFLVFEYLKMSMSPFS